MANQISHEINYGQRNFRVVDHVASFPKHWYIGHKLLIAQPQFASYCISPAYTFINRYAISIKYFQCLGLRVVQGVITSVFILCEVLRSCPLY